MAPIGLRWLAIPLLALAVVGVASRARAVETTPLEITLDPTRFTNQTVTVQGTITNLLPRRMGGPGATFDVMERGAFVHVFSLTPAPCFAGSQITVTGRFLNSQVLGGQTITNVIEAFTMSCP